MNPETDIQDGIYDDISVLLYKADSSEKASGFLAQYLQSKFYYGVIDEYDFAVFDHGPDGLWANVEFRFSWKPEGDLCRLLVLPKESLGAAYDRAMSIV